MFSMYHLHEIYCVGLGWNNIPPDNFVEQRYRYPPGALSKEHRKCFLAMSPGAGWTTCQNESEPEHQQAHNLCRAVKLNISSVQPQKPSLLLLLQHHAALGELSPAPS